MSQEIPQGGGPQRSSVLEFVYKNYKGVIEKRTVQPKLLAFGDTGRYHDHAFDWFVSAFDCDRGAERVFLLRDMSAPRIVDRSDYDRKLLDRILAKMSAVRRPA